MSDITRPIEPFELTQGFGENPASYEKFGLKGHNGWDIRTRYPDTPNGFRNVLASWLSEMYKISVDPTGYGNYFEVVIKLKSTWKLTYGHNTSIESFKSKSEGETMAVSGSTGNSTGPHVHLTTKRINIVNGVHQVIDYDNGYFGAVNPQEFFDELRAYKKTGNVPKPIGGIVMQIDDVLYGKLVNKSTERDVIREYLEVPQDPLDDKATKAIESIKGKENLATGLQRQLKEADTQVENYKDKADRIQRTADASAKTYEARITALETSQKAFDSERESLKGQIEQHAQAEGTAKIEAGQWKTKYEQALVGVTTPLTFGDVLVLLFKKAFSIKLS